MCSMGLGRVRNAVDSGELPSIPKGYGTNRTHRIVLHEDLIEWLRSLRDQATTGNGSPRPAPRYDESMSVSCGDERRDDGLTFDNPPN